MIKIDRSSVREPRGLKTLREKGYDHARKFFKETPLRERRQLRYFNPYWEKLEPVPVKALLKLFRGKCGWCERYVDPRRDIIDHLRPRWATRGLGRQYSHDHYWWLAFIWENLYVSCPACNKSRGTRFPVKGRRVKGPGEDLGNETPLMLDPCADDPFAHLQFEDSGRVTPLSRKGDVTIQLLALNRTDLVRSRRACAQAVKQAWRQAASSLRSPTRDPAADDKLRAIVDPEREFSACATQVLERLLAAKHLPGLTGVAATTPRRSRTRRKALKRVPASATPRIIEGISLRNFKGIASLTLRLPTTDERNMDWMMLIGENAAGKSSILQAVALNLMGDVDRERLALPHRRFIKRGAALASVEIRFRNEDQPRTLRISRTGGFKSSDPKACVPVMAYGATRLPPQAGGPGRKLPLENLFNPFAPLADASSWLLSLADSNRREEFDYAVRALAALLPGETRRWRFRALKNDISVDPEGPLRDLSDGYQSVLALAADMMATLQQHFGGGMEAAEGIVLLDELGAHLHPRWKMRLTTVLRRAFPRLQFIVTTHDPLCLRGLRNGEIVTIQKTSRGRVFCRTDLPPVEGMRVDQILQSEYFGLRSVLDPTIEAQFDRLYRLKAKPPTTLTEKQAETLRDLEATLAPLEVAGATRAERLMLSEINRFLALEKAQPSPSLRTQAWQDAGKRIATELHHELGVQL